MTGFWVGGAVLLAVALAFLLVPLWRERANSGRWSLGGVVGAVAVVPTAVALYLTVTTWPGESQGPASSETAMVAQLAAKMAENPDDVEGWKLLGRSYMVLGEYARGRSAYLEAWKRTPEPDNELKLALGEAMILADRNSLSSDGAQLVEDVLREEPDNQRALWYGGLVAMEIGRTEVARTRWNRFLAFDPPEEVASTVRRLLAELPESGEGDASTPAGRPPGGAAGGSSPASTPGGLTLNLDVSLGDGVPSAQVAQASALFIFARAPGQRAPVAVIRQPMSALPGEFTLSDSNLMLPGRSLADFPELTLVARVSMSGQPIEQSGDLYAEATYRSGDDSTVALVIDRVVP